jgi:hypothetical protein
MASLVSILTLVALVGPPLRTTARIGTPLRVDVRGGSAGDGVVRIEIQNVSGATVEGPAELSLMMSPTNRVAGPLFGGTLQSSADGVTGKFGGYYAARMSYPPMNRTTTLRLEPGEKRTVSVRLLELRWSLAPQWVEQPREFWELAGAGDYRLQTMLVLLDEHGTYASAGEVKVRIAGQ